MHQLPPDIASEGLRLHWSRHGKGPKTIMLVHGWACDETTWGEQVPELAKEYQVLTLDLPGHGRSQAPSGGRFSLDLFARAVDAVRVAANVERLALIGHSLGTPVVLRYAGRFPEHVAALAFIEGVITQRRTPAFEPERLAGPAGRQAFAQIIRRNLFSAWTTPVLQDRILAMMLAAPQTTIVGVAKAMRDRSEWDDQTLDLPILAIYRDKSLLIDWRVVKTRFPALDYKEIAGAGHFVMLERPNEVNQLLLDFLRKQKL
jgi:pimeloyl-ACP methyl ester carboxylesterase